MAFRLASALLLALTLVRGAEAQSGSPGVAKRGDTTVVRVLSPGPWGPQRAAGLVATIIGTPDGEPFGMITALAALPDGGVVIFDVKGPDGPVAWVIDAGGRFERQLGRAGGGPGEYRFCYDCLVTNLDGSIGLLDKENQRITTYERRGSVRSTTPLPTGVGNGAPPQFLPGPPGTYYARLETTPYPTKPITDPEEYARFGYVRVAERGGILDTLRPPRSWSTTPARSLLEPRTIWRPLPDGRVVVGSTERLRLLVHGTEGSAHRPLLIEGPSKRIAFGKEERTKLRAIWSYANTNLRKPPSGQTPLPADLPQLKPFFRGFETDHAGRLLVQLHSVALRAPAGLIPEQVPIMSEHGRPMPARPVLDYVEPPLFAVFEGDGTYLGEVLFPVNVVKLSFTGSVAWVILKDADGQDILARYSLPVVGKTR